MRLSANNSIFIYIFYQYLYRPTPNSLSDFLNCYSKSSPHPITVVQIGANDGITHDPIHKFIKRDKWKGVLLEPQKNVFNTLAYLYKKNKGIVTLNAALDTCDGEGKIYKIAFSEARWANGLTSFNKATLQSAFDSGYVAEKAREDGLEIPNDSSACIAEEPVELISPCTLIEKYNLGNIDILQIDTEGYDFEIIKMFLATQTTPPLIVFESKHLSAVDTTNCIAYLTSNHYRTRKFGGNTVALQKVDTRFERFFNQP
ncbi:MAG: FkbM family methyltransferase [Saprospiraceae bacterium]|nr:FkbM family methyltransferase [Saprospiraceae bacterium]